MPQIERNLSGSETRNSGLRRLADPTVRIATNALHKALPDLKPTQITVAGAVGTVIGSALAVEGHKKSAFLVLAGSALLDAFDGALARKIDAESPGSVNFERGAILDPLSDRTQELTNALARAVSANRRRSGIGKTLALASAVSNSLPSTAKAFAESRGVTVPESGKGLKGFAGTRVGRAVLGTIFTVFPEVKGVPAQAIADTIVTGANVTTTIERLNAAFTGKATLPEKDRAAAEARFKALTVFSAIAVSASAVTYLKLNQRKPEQDTKPAETPISEQDYLQIISSVENYCRQNNLDHRFVGGTVTDLIGPQTTFEIDILNRKISLFNTNTLSMIRSDGSVKDMDLVVFTRNRKDFLRARKTFELREAEAKAQNRPFPQVSVEAAYQQNWPRRSRLKQFVSAFEFDQDGDISLAFGDTVQEIPVESIEPWTIDIDGQTQITALNPVAHRTCYDLRVPSGMKPKDVAKMPPIEKFAIEVIKEGLTKDIDYTEMYANWWAYVEKLQKQPDLLTKVKGKITGFWWKTLGTAATHGKGPFGTLARLNNRMNG